MSGADKKRWPWERANALAQELVGDLAEACVRIEVAGSVRRRKREVGDVEILYVPRVAPIPDPGNLFGEEVLCDFTVNAIAQLEVSGVLARRKNVKGGEAFGEKNKLMVHVPTGIPVDLFAATEENWFNYLVCRTGGAESNVAIASAAIRKGWKWNPYGAGFSQEAHQGPYGPVPERLHPVRSEEEVFAFVGLRYRPPMERS